MSSPNSGLSVRALAELSLVISRMASSRRDESAIPSTNSLKLFWQSSRSLERQWMKVLDDWTAEGSLNIERLERLAPRVFACEMVARIWSTVIAGVDRRRGTDDLIRLARSAVGGLLRIRNGILARILTVPAGQSNRVLELDRLRRRCDRWTDVLLGPTALENGCFEFAFDAGRARDFAEESLTANPVTGPNAAEHLRSAGLRLTFLRYLSDEPIDEPEIVSLTQSILSNVPGQSMRRDGTLLSLLEHRIVASRRQLECRAAIPFSLLESVKMSSMKAQVDLSKQKPADQ